MLTKEEEAYNALNPQQKHTVRRKFTNEFSCSNMTFYRKIGNKVKVRLAEQNFFQNNLTHKKANA